MPGSIYDMQRRKRKKITDECTKEEWRLLKDMWDSDYPTYALRAAIVAMRGSKDPGRVEEVVRKVMEESEEPESVMSALVPIILEEAGVQPIPVEIAENDFGDYYEVLEHNWSSIDTAAVEAAMDDYLLKELGIVIDRRKMSLRRQLETVKQRLSEMPEFCTDGGVRHPKTWRTDRGAYMYGAMMELRDTVAPWLEI